jgi:pteridine reductase
MPLAVVTGASSLIGQAIVQDLARRGYDLIVHGFRNGASPGEFIKADLSTATGQDEFCTAVKARASSIDVLVHNAASYPESTLRTLDRKSWRAVIGLNAEAPLFITQGLLPQLEAAPSPSIVCMTDAMANRVSQNYFAYIASKAMLTQLTLALSAQLAPRIRVNAVAPGVVSFPKNMPEDRKARIMTKVPLGRMATPEDIASAVTYLACDATYITGEILMVDGGRQLV